ncbi:uncharacterized protein LOC127720759 [Mytilus californianus]|uniref:uncharacterized protein LOC127720759 n=1 Tax=Mytilus californianus TaxID=6549 RepID=UPI0022474183|nr:uncharacterized protein LOC127720759 [Mytilus californianus]
MFNRSPRPGATKVAVCITDGLSVSPNYTKIESMRAHEEGIQMFALGIGQHVFKTELVFIASQLDYVKEVPDYSALPTNLATEICNLNVGTTTTTYKSTTSEDLAIDRIDGTQINDRVGTSTTSNIVINDVCSLKPDPNDPTLYLEHVTGHGTITRHCAPGTAFQQSSCSCSTLVQTDSSNNNKNQTIDATTTPKTQSCTTNLYLTFNKSPDDPNGMMDRSGMSTPMSCHNINITDSPDGKAVFGYQDCFIYLWRFASIDFR